MSLDSGKRPWYDTDGVGFGGMARACEDGLVIVGDGEAVVRALLLASRALSRPHLGLGLGLELGLGLRSGLR